MVDNKFGKEYKLCSKITIEDIFQKGSTIKEFPFVLRYLETELNSSVPFQVVISAPKKKFKRAVDRNRIKRLCKEVIRLNKASLESFCRDNDKQLALFLIFSNNEEMSFKLMNHKIQKLINKLIQKLDEQNK